jgi:acetolactate synthase-1/2/3 large subunit
MPPPRLSDSSGAALIARLLKAHGVRRVYGLCGGHIMPIWMRLDAEGIRIVDVRDERAAVYMAHAEAVLSGGPGVAIVTAGPGVTNAMTGIANAHVAKAPVLVLSGLPPTAQENRGALQDIVHTDLVRSITRTARTVRHPDLIAQELETALARALGWGTEPGPVYLDFPVDILRADVATAVCLDEFFIHRPQAPVPPNPSELEEAVRLLWSAKRPLFIAGRGAKDAGPHLAELLTRLHAAYLDTGESRGLIHDDHPSVVAAMRATAMAEADLVVTVGRRLDFQLAYGSPAIFGAARFLRIADSISELRDNRVGTLGLFANPALTLKAILANLPSVEPASNPQWLGGLRSQHLQRAEKLAIGMREAAPGRDGRMHPNRVISALRDALPSNAVVIADGGDFLSFARVGLPAGTYLDPGSLGCIGVGTAFGIAASLVHHDRSVVVATGDGAFGFNALEIDTAVRHQIPLLIVVANNGSWAIEVRDQEESHGRVVGTRLQFADHAAMARAFSMHAERVENPDDLPAALQRALTVLSQGRPALIDVVVTPEAASSDAKSGLAWVPDLQALDAWDTAERVWRAGANRLSYRP